jgi:hypothetical protein
MNGIPQVLPLLQRYAFLIIARSKLVLSIFHIFVSLFPGIAQGCALSVDGVGAEVNLVPQESSIGSNREVSTIRKVTLAMASPVTPSSALRRPQPGRKRRLNGVKTDSDSSSDNRKRVAASVPAKNDNVHSNVANQDSSLGNNLANEQVRQLLEAKAHQIILDHESSRAADEHLDKDKELEAANFSALDIACDTKPTTGSVPTDASSYSVLPDDELLLSYFPNIVSAWNRSSITDLDKSINGIIAPNCVFRTHVIPVPGQTQVHLSDRIIQASEIFNWFKGVSESFPDLMSTIDSSKIITSEDGRMKTVVGYYFLRGKKSVVSIMLDKICFCERC